MEYESQLSAEDEALLSAWLNGEQTPVNSFSLMACKGFLFALVCGPVPLEAETWMSVILGGEEEFPLPQDKLFALITLHNQISDAVYETGYRLPPELQLEKPTEACFQPGHPLHEWCLGFVTGAAFYPSEMALQGDDELAQAFALAGVSLGFFADQQQAMAMAKMQEMTLSVLAQEMFSLMPDFAEGFAVLVEQVALASGAVAEDDWQDED